LVRSVSGKPERARFLSVPLYNATASALETQRPGMKALCAIEYLPSIQSRSVSSRSQAWGSGRFPRQWPLLSLRVFHFEQTYLANARQISRLNRIVRQRSMTMPKNDKYKDYARYAERCLNMVAATTDRESIPFSAKWPPNG